LIGRDLDGLGVGEEGVLEIEVLDCRTLLSVVLRKPTQDVAVAARRVADDLLSSRAWRDRYGLKHDAPSTIDRGSYEIAIPKLCFGEDVGRKRHHARVADATHLDRRHGSPPLGVYTVYTSPAGVK